MNFNHSFFSRKQQLKNIDIRKYGIHSVLTSKGNIYCKIIFNALSDESINEHSFLSELKSNDDTQIQKIVCLWSNGDIDMPSWKFRKMLCELNVENKNAQMLLNGGISYIIKSILQTLT